MNHDLPTKTTARKDGVHNQARWDSRVYRETRVDRIENKRGNTQRWKRVSEKEARPLQNKSDIKRKKSAQPGSQAPVDLGHECLHKVVEHKTDRGLKN